MIINHIPSLGITTNFKNNKSKTKRRTNKQPNNQTWKGSYIIRCDMCYYAWVGPSWSWSYGSWIDNYLCNQCILPL